MKKREKLHLRILCVIIMCAILLPIVSSCADDAASNDPSDTKATVDGETVAEETPTGAEQYDPKLPEKDYGGYEFRIVTRDDAMHPYPMHTRDVMAEELTGLGINDVVYYRNLAVEEKYNIKVKMEMHSETANENTSNTLVENSVMAGADDFDLLLTHMINGGTSALKNVFLNWNVIPHIDFEKPYWNQSAYEAFSVGEKTYLALSDMCVSSNDNTHCMIFNKKLAEETGIENLYDLVYNNQWTFDKFRQLVSDVSFDVNGDSKMDANDVYGHLIAGTSGILNWLYAAGQLITTKDENNYPTLTMYNETTVAAYDFIYELAMSEDSFTTSSWVETNGINMFIADQALIMSTQVGMIEHLRNMDSDFGILPYPKFSESQENYAHYVDGHATIMAIPKTVQDQERTGIFLEQMAYESFRTVLPQYYDVMMMNKYVRDEDSKAMFEIVYNTRTFDFAYVYDGWNLAFAFSNLIAQKNENFTSYYTKMEKIENINIDKAIKQYDEGD